MNTKQKRPPTATSDAVNIAGAQGMAALKVGDMALAEKSFRALLELSPDDAEAHLKLGQVLAKMLRMDEAEVHIRKVIDAHPESAAAHYLLGTTVSVMGRREEAEQALRRALELQPGWADAQRDLDDLLSSSGKTAKSRRKLLRWPFGISELDDLYEAAKKHVVDQEAQPAFEITKDSHFFTMGSCFARNLAEALRRSGQPSAYFPYVEEINSTFANRYFFEWLIGALDDDDLKARFDEEIGVENKEKLHGLISAANIMIFTVGVAPCFFDASSGRFILPRKSNVSLYGRDNIFRMTTVEENKNNLNRVVDIIKGINSDANISITISPVPLKASLDMPSVVQADCISKSTLRVAVHELMQQQRPGVSYWPSFEIVRWLGVYFEQTFGADDQNARHVSQKVVDVIIRLFMGHHMAA